MDPVFQLSSMKTRKAPHVFLLHDSCFAGIMLRSSFRSHPAWNRDGVNELCFLYLPLQEEIFVLHDRFTVRSGH